MSTFRAYITIKRWYEVIYGESNYTFGLPLDLGELERSKSAAEVIHILKALVKELS